MIQNVVTLGFTLMTLIIVQIFLGYASKGRLFELRNIPALEAFPEAIGRCAEMAKPCMFSIKGKLTSSDASSTVASLSLLSYVTSLCAKSDVKLVVPMDDPATSLLAEDVVYNAYLLEGKPEMFDRANVPYWGSSRAHDGALIEFIGKHKPGAVFHFGQYSSEAIAIPEATKRIGSIIIGGTARVAHSYELIIFDHALWGEELLAAGAYLTNDPQQLATITAEDVIKYIALGILGLSIVLYALGVTDILNWLKL